MRKLANICVLRGNNVRKAFQKNRPCSSCTHSIPIRYGALESEEWRRGEKCERGRAGGGANY